MSFREKLALWLAQPWVGNAIVAVIIVNAITLGMETSPSLMEAAGPLILMIDRICLGIFVVEIVLKLIAHGGRFFRSGWNVFDFAIVGIALVPAGHGLSVLRALRMAVPRFLRLASAAKRCCRRSAISSPR